MNPSIPTIIYEDDDMLVVNKPAGVVVNKSDTTAGMQTLQDWVEKKYSISNIQHPTSKEKQQDSDGHEYQTPEEAFYERSGIVHRLDKETSGIILVAKNPKAFEVLQKEFKDRVVKKTYLALAHGIISPETGEINVPVGRLEFNRKRFGVVAGGRESVTRYRVISNYEFLISKKKEKLSLVELYPQTGRTHQIRVHLKHINHPIFGDELYAGRKTARDDRKILPRVFLHAYKISFLHPTTGKEMSFTAELPKELRQVLG